ncbi:MAG: hypothetical protein VZR27_07025 [Acutalibacteraceae bacterium]|nr:hypothetical protein [Clostridia bacterium]MEE3450435.1 hypothetical protein [Acutalibacteraceae bacterium]
MAVGLSAPPALIVAIGIKGVSSIAALSGIVAATGAVSLAGGTAAAVVSSVKKQNSTKLLESELESERKSFSDYAQDSLNPEKTRVRFEQLRKNNPSLGDIIDKCIIQMDKMDSFQSRQQSLLDANEAVYLLDTVEVIRESERRMCRNFRNIINCCILVEDSTSDVSELDYDVIDSSLNDNEEELKSVSTLLKYSVTYINNYNRNGVKDRSELDAWLKVMKESIGG